MKRRLETPPVEVMTTTIRTCGCSASTSMWRIVEVSIGGAVTIASRSVTCDSVSVVTRIASSSSFCDQREAQAGAGRGLGGQQAVDEVAIAGLGGHPAGRGVGMGEQPELLEAGQLVADRRRAPVEGGAQRLGADRAPRRPGTPGRALRSTSSWRSVSIARIVGRGPAGPPGSGGRAAGSIDPEVGLGVADDPLAVLGRLGAGRSRGRPARCRRCRSR